MITYCRMHKPLERTKLSLHIQNITFHLDKNKLKIFKRTNLALYIDVVHVGRQCFSLSFVSTPLQYPTCTCHLQIVSLFFSSTYHQFIIILVSFFFFFSKKIITLCIFQESISKYNIISNTKFKLMFSKCKYMCMQSHACHVVFQNLRHLFNMCLDTYPDAFEPSFSCMVCKIVAASDNISKKDSFPSSSICTI